MSDRLAMIEKMIANGSEDPFVWYARAMEFRSRKELEAALRSYQDVRDKFPTYVPTYLMGAQVARELGLKEQARSWLEEGIEKASEAQEHHALSELRAELESIQGDI